MFTLFMTDKIHCAHILVKTETEAKNIKARLDKGEKFGSIAKNVSLCPSAKNSGDLAPLQGAKWLRSLKKLLSRLRKGKLLTP